MKTDEAVLAQTGANIAAGQDERDDRERDEHAHLRRTRGGVPFDKVGERVHFGDRHGRVRVGNDRSNRSDQRIRRQAPVLKPRLDFRAPEFADLAAPNRLLNRFG